MKSKGTMIKTAKHLLTACCTTGSNKHRNEFQERNYDFNYGSEAAEDFSAFRCAPLQPDAPNKINDLDSELYDSGFEGFDLPLRDPVHLLSSECTSDSENGTEKSENSSDKFNWIYPTKRLLKSSVQYHVFYLGGTKCYSPHGQAVVNSVNQNLGRNWLETRVIVRINAQDIKIIDSYTDNVEQTFQIESISFAAQDSNHESLFRKFAQTP
jgi:hypothetical protein